MKPSERLGEIELNIVKENKIDSCHLKDYVHVKLAAIHIYLDEAVENKQGFTTKETNLVELLKEIEIQKFKAQNQGARWERERLKKIFDDKYSSGEGYNQLREYLFGKD